MNPPSKEISIHSPAVKTDDGVFEMGRLSTTTCDRTIARDALLAEEENQKQSHPINKKRRWSNESSSSIINGKDGEDRSSPNKKLKTVSVTRDSCSYSSSLSSTTHRHSQSPMTLLNLGSAIVHARRASLSEQKKHSPAEQASFRARRRRSSSTTTTTTSPQDKILAHSEVLANSLRVVAPKQQQQQQQQLKDEPQQQEESSTAAPSAAELGYGTEEAVVPKAADLGYSDESAAATRRRPNIPANNRNRPQYLRRNSFVIHETKGGLRAGSFPWAAMDFLYQKRPSSSSTNNNEVLNRRLSAGSSS